MKAGQCPTHRDIPRFRDILRAQRSNNTVNNNSKNKRQQRFPCLVLFQAVSGRYPVTWVLGLSSRCRWQKGSTQRFGNSPEASRPWLINRGARVAIQGSELQVSALRYYATQKATRQNTRATDGKDRRTRRAHTRLGARTPPQLLSRCLREQGSVNICRAGTT